MKKYLKRGISLFLGVCLVLSILVLPGVIVAEAETTVPAGTNLIENGTFEKAGDEVLGWNKYNGGGEPLYYSADLKNSGNYSGAFNDNLSSAAHGMTQTITLPDAEGGTYTLSAWIYTETEMQCDIACKPASVNYKKSSKDIGWRLVEKTGIVVPEGTTSVNINIFNNKSTADGIMYVDDVSFIKDGTDVNLVTNPGFEERSVSANSEGWGNTSHYTVVENAAADVEKVGSYSMKVVTVAGTSLAPYWTGSVNGGKSYSFSVTYKSDFTARTPEVIIYYKNADGDVLETNTKALSGTAATWTDYEVTTIAPAEAAQVQINLNFKKAAEGTAYFDNISFVEKVTTFELKGATVDLGNSLDMNFYIDPADLTDGETYTAEIVRSYADGTADDVQTVTVDPAKVDANNNNYIYVTYSDIAAKEMGDEIKVTIYDSANNAVSQTWTDSVAQYIGRVVADNGDDAELLAVCADLLNYGAAAQNKFSYDTGNLVDSDLSDIRTVTVTGEATTAEAKKGTTLTLKSNILMEMFFYKDKVGEATTATVSYTNHNGAVVNKVVDLTEDAYYTDALSVQIDGLVIADINTVVTVTVGDVTVTDTMAWFVDRSESADIYNAILALGDSAYAYFH